MNDLDRTALLAAIKADPDDDLPRLAYADWLEEYGDDDRANFIRAQLEAARLPEGNLRRKTLERTALSLQNKHPEWVGKLKSSRCLDVTFERGFANATIGSSQFMVYADKLSTEPALGLTIDISIAGHVLPELAESPFIDQFREIRLAGAGGMGDAQAIYIAGRPEFKNLAGLKLTQRITNAGVRAIAQSPHLTKLTSLDFGYNGRDDGITNEGIMALADSPNVAHLTDLTLAGNPLEDAEGRVLAESPHLGNLTRFDLRRTRIGDPTIAALADPFCPITKLTSLDLGETAITGEGIITLASSPHFRHLTTLDVSHPAGGPRALASLQSITRSPYLRNLRRLNLDSYGNMGLAGMEALAASPNLQNIDQLILQDCGIDDAGAAALAKSANVSSLTHLDISYNRITDQGAMALAGSPHLANLETLDVQFTDITQEGLLALARDLPNLTRLHYYDENIGHHAENEIARILETRRKEHIR